MHQNYLSTHLVDDLCIRSLGEYFSYLKMKFTTSSSLAKNHEKYEISIDDESDDLITVNDLNERHQISPELQTNAQCYDVTQHHQAHEPFYNMNQNYPVLEESYEINTHHHIDESYETADLYSEINSQAESNNQYNQTNSKNDADVNYNLPNNGLHIVPGSLFQLKTKRSITARKRRNKKTNIRHRRNRYNFHLIRPVDTTITHVKRILHSYAVPYLNVNIVRSTLYIELKSRSFQDYYEQLLLMDLFI
ncbi:unnamed protein product [Rotaria sp. Silwood2]|nr:unnamed protein product [Rotaria sp. Silwood2]CAF3218895.1 unnamed protein product [Rotaria sp. Silwood2]CAF4300016.1 unnamed protein product [Rotaria sp. Silwood2]CAF4405214.1 unnamed protein product [Rotaria sp. Silwood2]